MTRCIEPTAVTPPVAASRPRAGAAIPHRHSGVAAAALLLALSATPIEAQPRPAAIRAHVGGATFFEAARHFNAGASYRKYFGARGWALELGVSKTAIAKITGVSRTALYSFMTTRGLRPSR